MKLVKFRSKSFKKSLSRAVLLLVLPLLMLTFISCVAENSSLQTTRPISTLQPAHTMGPITSTPETVDGTITPSAEPERSIEPKETECLTDEKLEFTSITNPRNEVIGPSVELVEIVKVSLRSRYGEDWSDRYYVHEPSVLSTAIRHPLLPCEHTFVRVDPALKAPPSNLSLLITTDRIFFLSAEDLNKLLQDHGHYIKSNEEAVESFAVYVKLYVGDYYPDFGGGTREESFTEDILSTDLNQWAKKVKEKYDIDPRRFVAPRVSKKNSLYSLDCFTVSYASMPYGSSATVFHYRVRMDIKGAVLELEKIGKDQYTSF